MPPRGTGARVGPAGRRSPCLPEHGDGPTALALRTAETAGITIVGIVRDDGLEVFTRADRVATPRG
jgi:hypothetical protein